MCSDGKKSFREQGYPPRHDNSRIDDNKQKKRKTKPMQFIEETMR